MRTFACLTAAVLVLDEAPWWCWALFAAGVVFDAVAAGWAES